jgi:hypothetical protein
MLRGQGSSGGVRRWAGALLVLLFTVQFAAFAPRADAAVPPLERMMPEAAPDQLIVGFRPDLPEAARDALVARQRGRVLRKLAGIDAALIALPPGQAIAAGRMAFAMEGGVRYAEPNYQYRTDRVPADTYYTLVSANSGGLRRVGGGRRGRWRCQVRGGAALAPEARA